MNSPYERSATITPHTMPDDHGRQEFTADWVGKNGRKRGQVFFSLLEVVAQGFRDDGYQVHVAQVTP